MKFRPFVFVTSSTPQDLTLGGEATLGADSTCLSVNLEDLDMTGDVSLRPVRRVAAAGSGVRVTNGSAAAVRRSETLDDSDDYNSLDMTNRARLADDYMTNRLPPCAPPLSPSNLLGNDYNSPIIRPYPSVLETSESRASLPHLPPGSPPSLADVTSFSLPPSTTSTRGSLG